MAWTLINDMLWPLLACLVLVGIHSYLGVHVLARKVIFVDLALAQIAAVGAVYGVFWGLSFSENGYLIKLISVAFTLVGALAFSITRVKDEAIPHEAIIGIIYAAALSLTILISANLPHGADEVRQMLAGSILWITPHEVVITACIYAGVGVVHYVFRRQFWALSNHSPDSTRLTHPRAWDFLFYATFGLVVTSSVGIGGVLLVFGYLVIPSVIGVMLASSNKNRLLVGWFFGSLASIVGVILSYFTDLPSGPTIVVVLTLFLVIISLLRDWQKRGLAQIKVLPLLLSLILVAVVLALPIWLRQSAHHAHDLAGPESANAVKDWGTKEALAEAAVALKSEDHRVRHEIVSALSQNHIGNAEPILTEALSHETDPFIKIEIADALCHLGRIEGLAALFELSQPGVAEMVREEALRHFLDAFERKPPLDNLPAWWVEHRQLLKFDAAVKKFRY
jgi:zinc/manganese transport system permease protein